MRRMTWRAMGHANITCHIIGCHVTQYVRCTMRWMTKFLANMARHIIECGARQEMGCKLRVNDMESCSNIIRQALPPSARGDARRCRCCRRRR